MSGVYTYPKAELINPILGGLGALFLIYLALRQARTATRVAQTGNLQAEIASRRHVTDTFGKAVEQLSSDKMEVRVGSIYTLERLAAEALASLAEGSSPDLYLTVMETLAVFVRVRARWQGSGTAAGGADKSDYLWGGKARSAKEPDETPLPPEPATDIAAVLAVICRRSGHEWEEQRGWQLDLRATDLRRANLDEAHLERAILFGAHLEGAVLRAADGLTQAQIEAAYGDAATELPAGLTRPAHWTAPGGGAAPAKP